MKRFACIAFVGAQIFVPSLSVAAEAAAQFEVMPPGAVSCASWTSGRDEAGRGYIVLLTEEGVLRAEREGWVAGYISALNVEVLPSDRGAARDLTEGLARDEIMTAIDNYCTENPLHSLLSATASVSLELANTWLAAHPLSGAVIGESAGLPTAGLAPADQAYPVAEEIAPPQVEAPPEIPAPTISEASPVPPPAPAAAAAAPPRLPAPMPSAPPTAAPVPDASDSSPVAEAVIAEPDSAPPQPATPEPAPMSPPELRGAVSALSGVAVLQVGAYRSSAVATQAWQDFLAEHGEVVADLVNDIEEVNLEASGVWHRLRIGPFADRDAANDLCATLKARGVDCFATPP